MAQSPRLFTQEFGDMATFSKEFYLSWDELKQIQNAGMVLAGHTHRHQALATLTDEETSVRLTNLHRTFGKNTNTQTVWPFTYPYGKRQLYRKRVSLLRESNYNCAFAPKSSDNRPEEKICC